MLVGDPDRSHFCRTVPAFTSRAKAAGTLPLSMPGRTNCCQKSSCRPAHWPWAAQFRETEKSFMSRPVEETQCGRRYREERTDGENSSWKPRLGHRAQSRWIEALHSKWRLGR